MFCVVVHVMNIHNHCQYCFILHVQFSFHEPDEVSLDSYTYITEFIFHLWWYIVEFFFVNVDELMIRLGFYSVFCNAIYILSNLEKTLHCDWHIELAYVYKHLYWSTTYLFFMPYSRELISQFTKFNCILATLFEIKVTIKEKTKLNKTNYWIEF